MDSATAMPTKPSDGGRRVVLLPIPFQGHINPMLQLGNMLHSKGFSIIILHNRLNSPNPTKNPQFSFVSIPEAGEEKLEVSDIGSVINFVQYLNKNGLDPIRDCLARLMSEEEGVACLVTDAQWFGVQKVADELKLPRIVQQTNSVAYFLSVAGTPILRELGYLRPLSDEELKSNKLVPGLEPIKVRDIPKLLVDNLEGLYDVLVNVAQGTKLAQAVIWNTFKELEEPELATLSHGFPTKHFLIGPYHKYFPASSSSFLTQDRTCIPWLDKHAPNSVLYVSFGSLSTLEESQFLEVAWGLANSKQPFLWVVRPGSVQGSEWLESLPEGFLETITEGKGYIVKWAPQQEVLGHPATGGFWTHSGWNSTLESICEGVPMICSPYFGDQPVNARYVSDVWKIGVELESGFERGEIESAIKRVMVDKEGLEMKERAMDLKEKVDICLEKGGSSYSSLEGLVNYILSC